MYKIKETNQRGEIMKLLKRFLIEEKAATAVEYAMIVGLIALVSFIAFVKLGRQVKQIIGWMYILLFGIKPPNNV